MHDDRARQQPAATGRRRRRAPPTTPRSTASPTSCCRPWSRSCRRRASARSRSARARGGFGSAGPRMRGPTLSSGARPIGRREPSRVMPATATRPRPSRAIGRPRGRSRGPAPHSTNGSSPPPLTAVGPGPDGADRRSTRPRGQEPPARSDGRDVARRRRLPAPADATPGTRVRAGDRLGAVDMLGVAQEVVAPGRRADRGEPRRSRRRPSSTARSSS